MKQFVSWLHLGSSNPYHGTIMRDPHKLDPGWREAIRVLAAFRKFKSLSRDNYEGSTQAGSWRHGKKQFVSWLHLGSFKSLSRDNYEGSSQAGSSRHGKKQVVSWLHLGARKTFSFGSFDTSNLITSPGAAKVTKSGPKGLPARIWAKTAVSAHFHTSSLIAGPEPRKSQNRIPKGVKSLSRGNYEGSTQAGCSNPYHGAIMKDPH